MQVTLPSGARRSVAFCLLLAPAMSCGGGGGGGSDVPVQVEIDVTVSGNGNGTITGNVGGIACTATAGTRSGTCAATLNEGSTIRLTAAPTNASTFSGWAGACAGSSTECTVVLGGDASVSAGFSLTPVTVAVAALPRGREGNAYTAQLLASGGAGTFTWALAGGSLPPGVSLAVTGLLSGTPTTRGSYDFSVRATSGAMSGDGSFTVVVDSALPPLEILTASLPAGLRGVPYSATLDGRGGLPPYLWAVTSGQPPIGLQLSPQGVITGTPTFVSTFNFTVRLTGAAIGQEATRTLTIEVTQPFAIGQEVLSNGRVGLAYSEVFNALGAVGPVTWSVSGGTLPNGLVLETSGLLHGPPAAHGTFTFTIQATDGTQTAEREFNVTIAPALLQIVPPIIGNQIIGQPFSFQLQATGGVGDYVWTRLAGFIPTGTTLSASGLISGTPTTAATFSSLVRVTSGTQMAEVSLVIRVTPPPGPPTIEVVAGNSQTSLAGNLVQVTPSVIVRDFAGDPIAGEVVTFIVEQGGGAVTVQSAPTRANGIATPSGWRLGTPGAQSLRASIPSGDVVFVANADVPPPADVNVVVRFLAATDPAIQAAFEQAAQRWERVLRGDLQDVPLNVPPDGTGCAPAINELVDDLLIYVTVQNIDGPGQILGSAGPRLIRSSGGLPVMGCMILDLADLNQLNQNGRLVDVITHEMGHVLGIGTLWTNAGLLQGAGGPDPTYSGAWGVAGFRALAGTGSFYTGVPVPVENTGGPGTRDGHWRDAILQSELMTGFLSPTTPMSVLTTASLRDLGYISIDAEADPYLIFPSISGLNLRADPRAPRLREVPPPWPIEAISADGRRTILRR